MPQDPIELIPYVLIGFLLVGAAALALSTRKPPVTPSTPHNCENKVPTTPTTNQKQERDYRKISEFVENMLLHGIMQPNEVDPKCIPYLSEHWQILVCQALVANGQLLPLAIPDEIVRKLDEATQNRVHRDQAELRILQERLAAADEQERSSAEEIKARLPHLLPFLERRQEESATAEA